MAKAAEGLFDPSIASLPPPYNRNPILQSVARVKPKTRLHINVFDSEDERKNWARNETTSDGIQHWYRGFLRNDQSRCTDPKFSARFVQHEFCEMIKQGATFPAEAWLDGAGTGVFISSDGLLLTNYHMVMACIELNEAEAGGWHNDGLACPGLTVEVTEVASDGSLRHQEVDGIRLLGNASFSEFYRPPGSDQRAAFDLDYAVLKIPFKPRSYQRLRTTDPAIGEKIFMFGFPLRTSRPEEAKKAVGYSDADGSMRVSHGAVVRLNGDNTFVTDADGAAGNSGSPTFDENGLLVGIFSAGFGELERNTIEYGYVSNQHVRASKILPRIKF